MVGLDSEVMKLENGSRIADVEASYSATIAQA